MSFANNTADTYGGTQVLSVDPSDWKALNDLFKKMPERISKRIIVSTFRKGGNKVKSAMRKNLPGYLKPVQKIISAKAGRSKTSPSLAVGFRGKKASITTRSGKEWDAYNLVYWFNYGTLQNRASGHTFINARKRKSARMLGGIHAKLFVERAWTESKSQAEDVINREFKNVLIKTLKKYVVA